MTVSACMVPKISLKALFKMFLWDSTTFYRCLLPIHWHSWTNNIGGHLLEAIKRTKKLSDYYYYGRPKWRLSRCSSYFSWSFSKSARKVQVILNSKREMPIGRAYRAFNMVRATARRASGLIYHVWVQGRVFLVMIFAWALALDILAEKIWKVRIFWPWIKRDLDF